MADAILSVRQRETRAGHCGGFWAQRRRFYLVRPTRSATLPRILVKNVQSNLIELFHSRNMNRKVAGR